MNFLKNKRRVLIAAALVLAAGAAAASTTGTGATDFDPATGRLEGWLGGSMGKTFALGSLAVGLAIGVVKQSVMAVVTGAAVALSASIGPGVLEGIFTATM